MIAHGNRALGGAGGLVATVSAAGLGLLDVAETGFCFGILGPRDHIRSHTAAPCSFGHHWQRSSHTVEEGGLSVMEWTGKCKSNQQVRGGGASGRRVDKGFLKEAFLICHVHVCEVRMDRLTLVGYPRRAVDMQDGRQLWDSSY